MNRGCCEISDSLYKVSGRISFRPVSKKDTYEIMIMWWVEYYDGLTEGRLLEQGLGQGRVIFYGPDGYLFDRSVSSPNEIGKYFVKIDEYELDPTLPYWMRLRVEFDPMYPYVDCSSSKFVERDLGVMFKSNRGRIVKFFDEEFGIIVE